MEEVVEVEEVEDLEVDEAEDSQGVVHLAHEDEEATRVEALDHDLDEVQVILVEVHRHQEDEKVGRDNFSFPSYYWFTFYAQKVVYSYTTFLVPSTYEQSPIYRKYLKNS